MLYDAKQPINQTTLTLGAFCSKLLSICHSSKFTASSPGMPSCHLAQSTGSLRIRLDAQVHALLSGLALDLICELFQGGVCLVLEHARNVAWATLICGICDDLTDLDMSRPAQAEPVLSLPDMLSTLGVAQKQKGTAKPVSRVRWGVTELHTWQGGMQPPYRAQHTVNY